MTSFSQETSLALIAPEHFSLLTCLLLLLVSHVLLQGLLQGLLLLQLSQGLLVQ